MGDLTVQLSGKDVAAIAVAVVDELERRGLVGGSAGPEWLTYEQAGEMLGGKTADAVRMLCDRGRLERRKVGRSALVSARSVRELDR
jgi:hypothetical protein